MVRITNHNAGLLGTTYPTTKVFKLVSYGNGLRGFNLLLRTSFESYISGVISEEDYLFQ